MTIKKRKNLGIKCRGNLTLSENFDGRVPLVRLPAYRPQLNTAEPVWAWLQGGQLKTGGGKTLDWFPQTVQKAFYGEHGEHGNHSAMFRTPRGGFLLKINSRLYNISVRETGSPHHSICFGGDEVTIQKLLAQSAYSLTPTSAG